MSRFGRPYRGGQHYARPENALKRAEELIKVGEVNNNTSNKQAALQTLHETLTTGRRNRQWSATFESIMFRHIDLCCETRKGRKAKEALQQYRNMCQAQNVASLEEVIKHFMKRAGEKAEEARSKAEAAIALDIEDLEIDATPEDIMLSYVSGEKSKDRTDRTFVTPWFRFLWETYRNLLDILRHNSRLEALYAMTIKRSFDFCLKYKRTSEFRRLCELLRSHLTNIQRRALYGKDQRDRPDLTNPETLQLHVDTRFEQLKVACQLELWQEAFRSVEDIINLVAINHKIISPGMMEKYYARLTEVFAFSDESILHCGYAWYKLFNLGRKYNKKLVPTDIQMLASNVLLTALSVRPYNRGSLRPGNERSDQTRDRQRRLANILGFGLDSKFQNEESYSRDALLTELSRKQFLKLVPPEIQQLYRLLEIDFKPLELCKVADQLMAAFENLKQPVSPKCPIQTVDFTKYVKRLQHVAVLKMLKHMSNVYLNMKTSSLAECVPFMSFGEVEAVIVDAVKNGYLQIRIDHKDGMLHFGGDTLDSDTFHTHICQMSERLSKSLKMIQPEDTPERKGKIMEAVEEARGKIEQEHTFALARKDLIERRKEEQEQVLLEKERAEERKRREQLEQVQAAEKQRRRQEAARREEDRIKREIEEKELEEAKAMLGNKKLKEGEKLDKKKIMHDVLTEKLKEQQELDRRLQKLARQMDHLERARREEELPYIEAAHAQFAIDDKNFHEEQTKRTLENKRKTWELDIAEKKRLLKMRGDRDVFEEQVRARRKEEFEELRLAHEKRKEERRIQRHNDRIHQRRLLFIDQCRTQIEEKIKEEDEARKVAEAEAKAQERARKKEQLDREFALQREREEAMDRRRAEEKAKMMSGGGADNDRWGARPARDNRWSSVGSDREIGAPAPAAAASGYIPPALRAARGAPPPRDPANEGWRPGGGRPRTPTSSPSRNRPDMRRDRSPRASPRRSPRRERTPPRQTDADRWERKSPPRSPRGPPRPREDDGGGWQRPRQRSPGPRRERTPPRQTDADRWERRSPPRASPPMPRAKPDGDRWERVGGGRQSPRRAPPSPRRNRTPPRREAYQPVRSGGGYVPPAARSGGGGFDQGPRRFDDNPPPRRYDNGPPPRRYDDRRGPPPRREDGGGGGGGGGGYVPPGRRTTTGGAGAGSGGGSRW